MADEPPERGRTFPVPAWWTDKAQAVAKERKISDQQLADLIRSRLGLVFSRHQVMRAKSGERPVIDTVEAISIILEIPRPFAIARTEPEALAIAGAMAMLDRHLRQADAQAAVLKAGVPEPENVHQTPQVEPVHGSSARRRKPGRGVQRRMGAAR